MSFDLRNVDGFDFTGKIRDQGGCGSCYTVAFTQAVESKLKVKYGKDVP
jgi:Fe-S cluster biogenesis protein NfuA